MARNIEIKAKTLDPARVAAYAQTLTDTPPQRLHQVDTYFQIPFGRLKLRVIGPGSAELIYYRRDNQQKARRSMYRRIPIWTPRIARSLLSFLLRKRGEVIKDRFVYLVGQTRIHLDHVHSLGTFVELEVVLRGEQADSDGMHTAMRLMNDLKISDSDLVGSSYIDLMETTGTVH